MKLSFRLLLYFVFCTQLVFGTIRNVPATYPTIQGALSACLPGDTIMVQPGTYNETLVWPTSINGIKLISTGGSANTSINAGGIGRVIHINSSTIDTNTVIRGFTISGGYLSATTGYGAGVYVQNASVIMDDVNITGNRVFRPGSHGYGAGLNLSSSSSIIINSSISGNSIDSATWCYGAGVYVLGGAPSFSNVLIANNSTRAENWCYGVGFYAQSNANIKMNEVKVTGNISGDNAIWYYGTGIYMDDVTASLENVLIASNKSGAGGSFNYGGGIYADGTSSVTMMNVTITDNSKTGNATINGSGVYARDASVMMTNCISYNTNSGMEINSNSSGSVTATYSNIRGGLTGTGNLNVLPGFVSATDFHLTVGSLCAGSGTLTGAPVIDLDGNPRPMPVATMPDMGCYEVDQNPTGIENFISENKQLVIYPVPAIRGANITILNADDEVLISDVSGRKIVSTKANNGIVHLNTSGLVAGMYFVNSGKSQVRFVITQ